MKGDFHVGEWLVRPQTGAVSRGKERIRLEPRVMEVLVYLARHPDEVLPKERILAAVWNDSFVTDEVLTNAISALRKTFGEDARDPRLIQTLPRRGYRLRGPVVWEGDSGEVQQGEAPVESLDRQRRTRPWRSAAATVVVIVALLIVYWARPDPGVEDGSVIDSIAVLPFHSADEGRESESLAEGIPSSISSRLLRLPRLRVKPASVLQRYRGREVDPKTVSEEQGVQAVLIGTVESRGPSLTVAVELIRCRDNTLIWGQRYTRGLEDIFAVEEDIAQQVVGALRLGMTDEEGKRLAERGTRSPEAYEALLKADYEIKVRKVTESWEAVQKAVSSYERAIEIDPEYQDAYRRLIFFCFASARRGFDPDGYAKARSHALKMIEIDASTVSAHAVKAWLLWSYDRNWGEAEKEYVRAAELDPSFEPDGGYLEWMGHREKRLAQLQRELESADPLSYHQQALAGWGFLFNRAYDRAIEQARRSLAMEPKARDPFMILSITYTQKGLHQEAFAASLDHLDEDNRATAQDIFAKSGWAGVLRWRLEQRLTKPKRATIGIVQNYLGLGENDKALEWLEKCWERPLWGFENAPSNPQLDPLRDDPRFEALLRQQKLPEDVIARHLVH